MRRLSAVALAATFALVPAPSASAAPVYVLHGHHVELRDDPLARGPEFPPPSPAAAAAQRARVVAAQSSGSLGGRTRAALDRLERSGSIDKAAHDARVATLARALRTYRGLSGSRRSQLAAVLANADEMARAGTLTRSRLEPVFQTIERNREWWVNGRLLAYGDRVGFAGSQLVWQYYPGQGIQLQMLGNFGKANGLWTGRHKDEMRRMLAELVPLASSRGGGPVWEYYFRFGGGVPPWTSGISQGTAVQALARGSTYLKDPALRTLALRALRLFEQAPPVGVRVKDPRGAFYAIYSFAPGQRVLNAHLQAVIGLWDVFKATGSAQAKRLYDAGEHVARAILPGYDTGAWSRYEAGGAEADLNYQELVTTFLADLCKRNHEAVYCDAAARFKGYLHTPPKVTPRTSSVRSGARARIGFTLDKISRVGMTVRDGSGATVFSTSAVVSRGTHYFSWVVHAAPGTYELSVTGTDLAGNRSAPARRALRVTG